MTSEPPEAPDMDDDDLREAWENGTPVEIDVQLERCPSCEHTYSYKFCSHAFHGPRAEGVKSDGAGH